MAIVYIHKKKESGEVFYVGIGDCEKRAYSKDSRNRWWRFTVKKYDYIVEITHKDIIWEEACVIEKYLIAFYGRKNLGLGTLVNLTDGGDGSFGHVPSQETKQKTSNSLKGYKRSKEEINKATETKKLIGFYKKISKPIKRISIETGEEVIFSTSIEAAKMSNIPRSTMYLTLSNKTNKDGERIYAGGYDWQYYQEAS